MGGRKKLELTLIISHPNLDRWNATHVRQLGANVSGSAGVSPAIFQVSTKWKNAGETPALQHHA
jgi:hypothetical protein